MSNFSRPELGVIGILLAGGRASRIGGGDKGHRSVGGRSILERIVARMQAQCDGLVVNANGDPARFSALSLPVVGDGTPDRAGPLAGVLAGLDHVAACHPGEEFALTVPTDTPFLPTDLVARLQDQRVADRSMIVCASSGGQPHYTVALWAVALRHDLRRALAEGERRAFAFYARHPFATVEWPMTPFDPFFNVNTPADLAEAERIARLID